MRITYRLTIGGAMLLACNKSTGNDVEPGAISLLAPVCEREHKCASETGESFDYEQCQADASESTERARAKACDKELAAYVECADRVMPADCNDDPQHNISKGCGEPADAYHACMK